ncbi:hypothetical protein D3C72_713120 [compost metagenome]
MAASFGVEHVDGDGFPGRGQAGCAVFRVVAEGPAPVERGGGQGDLQGGAGFGDATGVQEATGDVCGYVGRSGLFGGDERQPQVEVPGLVRQAAQQVAACWSLPGRGVEAVEQPARCAWTQGLAGNGNPAPIVLRTPFKGGDQVLQGLVATGLGEREEIRRGRLEGGGKFAPGVLHAGGQAGIEIEPADEDGESLDGRLRRQAL